jgi:casein kinase II subunit alpha
MKDLLDLLSEIHDKNVFHRDLKFGNILEDENGLIVIDWGLTDFYDPELKYSSSVGTKVYKAPELLMNQTKYNLGVDIWSSGCILSSIVFGLPSLFSYHYNDGVLDRQIRFFWQRRI